MNFLTRGLEIMGLEDLAEINLRRPAEPCLFPKPVGKQLCLRAERESLLP